MGFFSYTFVKSGHLKKLNEDRKRQEHQIQSATEFIREIERGNLDVVFNSGKEENLDNLLATSLESMRSQMKKFALDEKERNWVTEGLARFVEILRASNNNTTELSENIIQQLVRYMNANQGAIYLVNDDTDDVFIELVACYAYNRKKHQSRRFGMGEGLTGQAILEKNTIYMTNLPGDFVKITSGLGEALPRNLLIVPLKIEEQVLGVVEIASFQQIKDYQIQFIERLGETIASSVANVKTNQRTKKLLEESQANAEVLRAQEEEMRQNMEELSATQEEMQRVLREVEGQEAYVKQLLNASTDTIFTIDRDYKLVSWNDTFAKTLEQFGMRLEKGSDTLDWYQGDERKKQIDIYKRVLNGETFEFTSESELNGSIYYFQATYTPLKNKFDEIVEAAIFSRDVTAATKARMQTEKLLAESQSQGEQLKAQEEEMRQNMEELSATQEEMHRILKEVEGKEAYIRQLLNASADSIFTVDRAYKLVTWNDAFAKTLEQFGMKLEKGADTLAWYQDDERKKQVEIYDRALNGETFEITAESDQNGTAYYFRSVYTPLRDKDNKIAEAAIFSRDVTEATVARMQTEKLLAETQNQTEEMKAQEEELRQNMEELSATQEEMHRVLKEVQKSEHYIKNLLDQSDDSILTLDRNFAVISHNKAFAAAFEDKGIAVGKGFDILQIFPEEARAAKTALYNRVFAGEVIEITDHLDTDGFNNYYKVKHAPLRDEAGKIEAISVIARDITELVRARGNKKG